ncbi:unnamed protein product [Gadus morhua 'NCC']
MMEFKMGFRSEKRVRLKAGVIPSIHAAPAAASGSATGGSEDHGPTAPYWTTPTLPFPNYSAPCWTTPTLPFPNYSAPYWTTPTLPFPN